MWITAILMLLLLLLDQGTKHLTIFLANRNMLPFELGSFLKIHLAYNDGAAFGLGSEFGWLLVLISFIATIMLGYLCMRNDWAHGKFGALGTTMAFAGCVGNLIDRVLMVANQRAGVVDMITFGPWDWFLRLFAKDSTNTFNVADLLLVFGLIMLIIDYLFLYDKRARKYGYYSKRK